jgi:exopolyphosphatase/guanosine-5'-triphosphate,3'-diphosphate pyrophosphatase
MVIFDCQHKIPVQIFNEKIFCGLGQDIPATKKLNKNAVATALLGLKAFSLLAKAKNVKKIITVGTAALRDAKDSKSFLARVKRETGLSIKIISGHDEAHYAALGVMSLEPEAKGLVADFGGGSLEFAKISNKKISSELSFPVGAFRIKPLKNKAFDHIQDILLPAFQSIKYTPNLYVIGGSWRALAQAYYIDQKKQGVRLHGCVMSASELIKFCHKVERMTSSQLIKIYRLEHHRAQLLPISSLALRAVVETLSIQNIIVSVAGIRDGIIFDHIRK